MFKWALPQQGHWLGEVPARTVPGTSVGVGRSATSRSASSLMHRNGASAPTQLVGRELKVRDFEEKWEQKLRDPFKPSIHIRDDPFQFLN